MATVALAPKRGKVFENFVVTVAAVYVLLGLLLRFVLWGYFGVGAGVKLAAMWGIIAAGIASDLAQLPYLLMPILLFLSALPKKWDSALLRNALPLSLGVVVFGMLFLAGLEYFFFEEFNARFNLVAVDYLIYPTEVLGNITDTYPVASIMAGILAVSLLVLLALSPLVKVPSGYQVARRVRLHWLLANAVLLILLMCWVPADFSAVFANRVANELAANGPSSFFAAMRTNHLEYPAYYRTGNAQALGAILHADLARGSQTGFNPQRAMGLSRQFAGRSDGLGKLNVVVLSEESFGAEFVGSYGDTRGLTPEFDTLTKEGLLFTHAYATGTRTVRGLEAITASFPPIPSESILKRPGNQNMATWGAVMQSLGYQTRFIYGGYGTFDNMNAFYKGNGFAISDRTEIENPKFSNIWGVSDEDLFAHAIKQFDQQSAAEQPFFAIVMSTSNHKPYTFPAGIEGVKPKGGGREAGIRYADYAIGSFFKAAKTKPWYKNTLFVVMADHGARVYGSATIPLFSYEIPFLIIAPKLEGGQRIDTLTSQIDVAPTVLGMLGLPYEAPFFGQDVLHWQGGDRSLFFNHNHNVALLKNNSLVILGLRKKATCQKYVRALGAAKRGSDIFSDIPCDTALLDLTTAYYQYGYDLFSEHLYQ